jgi:hypothetical protein
LRYEAEELAGESRVKMNRRDPEFLLCHVMLLALLLSSHGRQSARGRHDMLVDTLML